MIHLSFGRSRGISVMLSISIGHQGWSGHTGAIKMKSLTDSIHTFCITRDMKDGGGYAYTVLVQVQGWDKLSTPIASQSCSQV